MRRKSLKTTERALTGVGIQRPWTPEQAQADNVRRITGNAEAYLNITVGIPSFNRVDSSYRVERQVQVPEASTRKHDV